MTIHGQLDYTLHMVVNDSNVFVQEVYTCSRVLHVYIVTWYMYTLLHERAKTKHLNMTTTYHIVRWVIPR